MVAPDAPTRIIAVLDWEMGAIGDPRADVGYLLATYTEPGGARKRARLLTRDRRARVPVARELVSAYDERSGRDVQPLAWFEALALWKAAVFCEAIYGRFIRGELGAEDSRAALFEHGSAAARRDGARSAQLAASATPRSVSESRVETSSVVAPLSRHAARRSRIRLTEPTRATSSTNASGHLRRRLALIAVEEQLLDLAAPAPRSRSGQRDRCRSSFRRAPMPPM